MGRDQLFSVLRFHALRILRRKRIVRTTDSNNIFKRYPNLIRELIIAVRMLLFLYVNRHFEQLKKKRILFASCREFLFSTRTDGNHFPTSAKWSSISCFSPNEHQRKTQRL